MSSLIKSKAGRRVSCCRCAGFCFVLYIWTTAKEKKTRSLNHGRKTCFVELWLKIKKWYRSMCLITSCKAEKVGYAKKRMKQWICFLSGETSLGYWIFMISYEVNSLCLNWCFWKREYFPKAWHTYQTNNKIVIIIKQPHCQKMIN